MKIERIPPAFKYFCDSCGATHLQVNTIGHYTDSTPPGWTSFRVVEMGNDGNKRRAEEVLICPSCVAITKKTLFNRYQDKLMTTIFGEDAKP